MPRKSPSPATKALRRIRGRKSDDLGKLVQNMAVAELYRMGARGIQVYATPAVCMCVGGKPFKKHTAKVVGDISGFWPGGRGLLVESKARTRDGKPRRPTLSDFEDHQIRALKEAHELGGSALVAYLWEDNGMHRVLIEPACNWWATFQGIEVRSFITDMKTAEIP